MSGIQNKKLIFFAFLAQNQSKIRGFEGYF
jgi:hypothetical protein